MAKKKGATKAKAAARAAGNQWRKLQGKTFCFGGRWSKYSQDWLVRQIEAAGGTVVDQVTAKLDYVVVDSAKAGTTSAAEKQAIKLNQSAGANIQVIDENALGDMVRPTRDEAIAMLSAGPEGVAAWNQIRQAQPYGAMQGFDLRGLQLPGAKLDHVNLSEVDTSGSNFQGASLADALLQGGADLCLDDANLERADVISGLEHCTFTRARASAADFNIVRQCSLEGAHLEEAQIGILHKSSLRNVSARRLQLGRVYYQTSKLPAAECDFAGADLALAQLVGQDLSGSNFSGANLQQADMRNAVLRACDFRGADLRRALLAGADLSHSKVDGANFEGANLFGAKLYRVDHAKAIGLDPKKIKQSVVGPNLQEIDKVAAKARQLTASVDVALDQGHVEIKVTGARQYNYYQWFKHVPGADPEQGYDSNYWGGRTFSRVMIEVAQLWASGTPVLDSVQAGSVKSPLKGAELKKLVAAAWCEAFGIEMPSQEEIEKQKKSRASGQKQLRDELLAELLGPGGVKKWNARTPADFARAGSFRKADFTGAKLAGVKFQRLDLQSARFDGATLARAEFQQCKCNQASFKGADLQGATLNATAFSGADFTSANLTKAELVGCTLRKASFGGAKLGKADLSQADLTAADLSTADLTGAVLAGASFDGATRFPQGFKLPENMNWRGSGPNPAMLQAPKMKAGSLSMDDFMKRLRESVDESRLSKALSMLKADRFKLFVQVSDQSLVGVVKSQTDPELVYSCRLAADGAFACCTQNLNPCGGLRGALCKHLLVLIVGLARGGELDAATVDNWITASKAHKPVLDKDIMSETLLRYKGAEAGQIDWRPTETVPEDFYAL